MKAEKKQGKAPDGKMKLLSVLVVVFLVCGGNGVGILAGALIWRSTQKLVPAIAVMLAITLAAVVLALCLMLVLRRIAAQDEPEAEDPSGEPDSSVIPEA